MEVWAGTTNKGKLKEFEVLFQKSLPGWSLRSIQEMPAYTAPPETGKTFFENALIKAKSLKAVKPDCWTFAEDSGLEVQGLQGLPGVHSARYAGQKASDNENVAKVLKMMTLKNVKDRAARFHCCLIAFSPAGEQHVFEGTLNGTISPAPRGSMGFGYDPIFLPEGQTQTLAELGPGFKNQHSHRTKAFAQFLKLIPENRS